MTSHVEVANIVDGHIGNRIGSMTMLIILFLWLSVALRLRFLILIRPGSRRLPIGWRVSRVWSSGKLKLRTQTLV